MYQYRMGSNGTNAIVIVIVSLLPLFLKIVLTKIKSLVTKIKQIIIIIRNGPVYGAFLIN